MSVRAIVLAAGKGTRMNSPLPKVLFTVAGRPLVVWAVEAAAGAGADEIVVVIGPDAGDIAAILPDGVGTAVQEEPLGTGDAARAGFAGLSGWDVADTVLILPGDSPLIRAETLRRLLDEHARSDAACTMLTARFADPTGYGRVVRDGSRVVGIVEESDADDQTRAIDEVAVSTYAFDAASLDGALASLSSGNAQGEYYLTDAVAGLAESGVGTVETDDPDEVLGVNTHAQLAEVEGIMRRRINADLMAAGVAMPDPSRVYVDAGVVVEPGARLLPGSHLQGATTVAAAEIGPDAFVTDSIVAAGARVWYSVVRGAEIGPDVDVGPYASLRPGTVLHERAKAGSFVEVKASVVGPRSKVPHLSYVGDATIGSDTNIGAGTVTCNYDGFHKHETHIGDRVFIGSDTMLVAPVTVGDDAVTGAGSVITRDVAPGALAVERSPQKEVAGYAERRARRAEAEGE